MWHRLRGAGAAVLLTACSHASVAVHTASSEFRCPEDQFTVEELENNRYRVNGCGHTQVYECLYDRPCQREGWLAARAKQRAEREFSCPDGRIKVRWVQDETYRVEACGNAVTYACDQDRGCEPETSPVVLPAQ